MVFGTFVGSLADRFGRKLNCLAFGVLYACSCLTKHFNDYNMLLLGRLLGGVSTSILFSAFEAWMIHEHKRVRPRPVARGVPATASPSPRGPPLASAPSPTSGSPRPSST